MVLDFSDKSILTRIEGYTNDMTQYVSMMWYNGYSREINCFDLSHDHRHYFEVLNAANTLMYNAFINGDDQMTASEYIALITASMFHDSGTCDSRKHHEIVGAANLLQGKADVEQIFNRWFSGIGINNEFDDIVELAFNAIIDHRSVNKPSSVVSELLKDCDDISSTDEKRMVYRFCAFAVAHRESWMSTNELIDLIHSRVNKHVKNLGCVSELGQKYIEPHFCCSEVSKSEICSILSLAISEHKASESDTYRVPELSVISFPWKEVK